MMKHYRQDAEHAAAQLRATDDIAALLDACLVDNARDPKRLALMLGAVASKAGISDVARACHLSTETLRHELGGQRSPRFSTIQRAMHALGVELRVRVLEPR